MLQEAKDEVRDGHAFFDIEISSWIRSYSVTGRRTACGKGCSNCCNLAVSATFTEALCVADVLTEQQGVRVGEHVAQLVNSIGATTDLTSYLRRHRQEIGFCPLLEADGACGVYAERPFSCRALLATRESSFCALDFASISPHEREEFMASLDPAVVAFPSHYVAATRDMGQDYESLAARKMVNRFGFSLYGNLPVLLHLERNCRLSSIIAQGYEATVKLLQEEGVMHPFLLTLDRERR